MAKLFSFSGRAAGGIATRSSSFVPTAIAAIATAAWSVGNKLVSNRGACRSAIAKAAAGSIFTFSGFLSLTRRAKYILIDLDNNHTLISHLGMTGRFTTLKPEGGGTNLGEFYFQTAANPNADGPHDHVVFVLGNGIRMIYSDPRRFGMMDLAHTHELTNHSTYNGEGDCNPDSSKYLWQSVGDHKILEDSVTWQVHRPGKVDNVIVH